MTTENDGSQDVKYTIEGRGSRVEGRANQGRRIFCQLTADEFALVNWVRMKHQPANMDAWLRRTIRAAALEQARDQIARGRQLNQGMAEVLSRVREYH